MRGDFAWALEELRSGERVQREGWNGRGMYVTLQAGYPNGIPINANTADAIGEPEGTIHRFQPYFMLRTVDGSFVPWTASTADILAEDWKRYSGARQPLVDAPEADEDPDEDPEPPEEPEHPADREAGAT